MNDLKPCPFCGSEPSFTGDASEWKDDHRYVELSITCCATITEGIGWKRARGMSPAERTSDLRRRLTNLWNTRYTTESEVASDVSSTYGLEPLSEFREGQWWTRVLDAMVEQTGTAEQKRAVAVVHHMLLSARAADAVRMQGNEMTKPTYDAYTVSEMNDVNTPLFEAREAALRLGMMTIVRAINEVRGPLTDKLRDRLAKDADGMKEE